MATKYKTLGELFSESAQAVKRNLRLFIIFNILTILGVAWGIGSALRDKAAGNDWATVLWHSFTGEADYRINPTLNSLLTLAGLVLYIMVTILAVKAARQKIVSFEEVWEEFKLKWWKVILTVVAIAIPIIAGLIVLIIPGLYLVGRLGLAPYIVIDQEIGPLDAVNKSWQMTKNKAWPVFVAILFGVLLQVPSIVPVVGPVISLILAIAYSVGVPIRYFEMKGKPHREKA